MDSFRCFPDFNSDSIHLKQESDSTQLLDSNFVQTFNSTQLKIREFNLNQFANLNWFVQACWSQWLFGTNLWLKKIIGCPKLFSSCEAQMHACLNLDTVSLILCWPPISQAIHSCQLFCTGIYVLLCHSFNIDWIYIFGEKTSITYTNGCSNPSANSSTIPLVSFPSWLCFMQPLMTGVRYFLKLNIIGELRLGQWLDSSCKHYKATDKIGYW